MAVRTVFPKCYRNGFVLEKRQKTSKLRWHIGYKVVMLYCPEKGVFVSATTWGRPVRYEVNKITRRPLGCGPLSVFDISRAAKSFAWELSKWYSLCVFRCNYLESQDTTLWTPHYSFDREELPGYTVLADKVKLLEELPQDYKQT